MSELSTQQVIESHTRYVLGLRQQAISALQPFALATEAAASGIIADHTAGWQSLGLNDENGGFSADQIRDAIVETRRQRHSDAMIIAGMNARRGFVHSRGYSVRSDDPLVTDYLPSLTTNSDSDIWQGLSAREFVEKLFVDGSVIVRGHPSPDGQVAFLIQEPLELLPESNIKNPSDSRKTWLHYREFSSQQIRNGNLETVQVKVYHPDIAFSPSPETRAALEAVANQQSITIDWDRPIAKWTVGYGMPLAHVAIRWSKCTEAMLSLELAKHRLLAALPGAIRTGVENIESIADAMEKYSYEINEELAAAFAVLDGQFDITNVNIAMLNPKNIEPFERRVMMIFGVKRSAWMFEEPSNALNNGTNRNEEAVISAREEQGVFGEIYSTLATFAVHHAIASGSINVAHERIGVVDEFANQALGIAPKSVTYERYSADFTLKVTWPEILDKDVDTYVTSIVEAFTLGSFGNPIIGTPHGFWSEIVRLLMLENQDEVLKSLEGLEWSDLITENGNSVEAAILNRLKLAVENYDG